MLAASKTLLPKIIVPAVTGSSTLFLPVRHKGTGLYIMSPDPGWTNDTVGPYPRTKDDFERAAKKYNLITEDYEPYDEGEALGDYPKLPAIGTFNRDKYDDYDDPVDMRFYGEPFHLNQDLYGYERIDPLWKEKPGYPHWKKMLIMFGSFSVFPVLLYLNEKYDININHNFKQRDMFPDQKLYEFPQSSSDHHHQ